MPHSPLERRKIDVWNRMIDVNIKGVIYGIVIALPSCEGAESALMRPSGAVATNSPTRQRTKLRGSNPSI